MVEAELKYNNIKVDEWTDLMNQALYAILDITPAETLIEKMSGDCEWFMRNKNLVTITLNHFKELKGMFSASKKVNTSDWWSNYEKIGKEMGEGVFTGLAQKNGIHCSVVFERCGHSYPCSQKPKREDRDNLCFCNLCEESNESFKRNFFF